MATNDSADKKGQELNFQLRRALNNAYAFVKGRESVQSFSALTFEDCLDKQIERIEGTAPSLRPNDLTKVDRIESDILQAVEKMKQLPPENFIDPDPDVDVNTPVEPAEE